MNKFLDGLAWAIILTVGAAAAGGTGYLFVTDSEARGAIATVAGIAAVFWAMVRLIDRHIEDEPQPDGTGDYDEY